MDGRPTATSTPLVTRSPRMRAVIERAETMARADTSVLLVGETWVGKELLADHIHRTSSRREHPLIKISLSAMPSELVESELFGHQRGAFTGALAERRGLFELADGGTLFLDDIDDVSPAVQVKLLRVLEQGHIMRVGGSTVLPVDVRLITASKVDLKELVGRQAFRADLYYRINVCPLEIPPLRERREDIGLLARHFLGRFAASPAIEFTPPAERALETYDWPGNVRELRNVVHRLSLFAQGPIDAGDLPPEIRPDHGLSHLVRHCTRCLVDGGMSYGDVVACLETNLLRHALQESRGNRSQAARLLGLSLSTLRDKLRKYGLDDAGPDA
jgi:DNA-binding NtrC family response regulator